MSRRINALATTLGVAVATLTSALALDEPAARPQAAAKAEIRPGPAPATRPTLTTTVTAQAGKVAPVLKEAMKKAVAAQKAFVVAAPLAPGFNNQAQIQQYQQQFRPILRAEYHIVRVVCRLTPEQRRQIARDGEQAVREAARNYVEMMRRPMTAVQRAALDPRKQIRERLARAVKVHVSGEMRARYEAEIARRDAGRKQLAIRNLVSRLDRDLVLTRDQRDKVEESLAAHWDDSWCSSIQMFMYDNQYLPPIPDAYVVPFLNDAQKTVWRGTQKIQVYYGGFGTIGGIRIDDPLEDEELRAARLEAARNDPKPADGPAMRKDVLRKTP